MPEENILTDITVADISFILQIIEVCAKRGAFQPAEFSEIGKLVNKLTDSIKPALESIKDEQNDI